MKKGMIDADALLNWIKATKGLFDDETLDDFYSSTIEKIKELSSEKHKNYVEVNLLKNKLSELTFPREYGYMPYFSAIITKIKSCIDSISTYTEPQESIFDADGWCYDIDKAPKDQDILMIAEQWRSPVVGYYLDELERWHCRHHPMSVTPIAWVSMPKHCILNIEGGVLRRPLPTLPTGGLDE